MSGSATRHLQRPRARIVRAIMCVSLAAFALPLHAQRPTPANGWVIDTTSERPVATRKGGVMSSDARAELLGPMAWTGVSALDWLRKFSHDDAGTYGLVVPNRQDAASVSPIAGQQMIVAAYEVRASTGTLYLSYSMPNATAAGAPAIVIRSRFTDALTLVRAFKSSVETLLPYLVTPTPQMRALAVAAAPVPVPTSFRTTTPRQDATGATTIAVDSASTDTARVSATGVGISDAIALLADDSAATVEGSAASTRTQRTARQPVVASPASTAAISEAGIAQVVFYQWGDLQYHPVALFHDGSTFDLDATAIDATDVPRSRAESPGKWGRWRHTGLRYFLTDGKSRRVSEWTLGSGFHLAFAAPAAGNLNGRYKAVSGSTMGEMSTLLTSTMRFLPDGRFTRGADFAAVGSGDISGVSMAGGSSKSSTGRYRINKYHIDLIYDNGQSISYFFAFGSSGSPARLDRDMIFIGDTAYVLDNP